MYLINTYHPAAVEKGVMDRDDSVNVLFPKEHRKRDEKEYIYIYIKV